MKRFLDRHQTSPSSGSWRRATVLLSCGLLAACASSSSSDSGQLPVSNPDVRTSAIRGPGFSRVDIYNRPGVGARTIGAPVATIWRELPGVFETLGIPVTVADPASRRIGNPGYEVRRIEGNRMATYVDCGTSLQGQLANLYEITLTVITELTEASADSTVVTTTIDAFGEPRAVSGSPSHCDSKGVLELRVAQLVGERLGLN